MRSLRRNYYVLCNHCVCNFFNQESVKISFVKVNGSAYHLWNVNRKQQTCEGYFTLNNEFKAEWSGKVNSKLKNNNNCAFTLKLKLIFFKNSNLAINPRPTYLPPTSELKIWWATSLSKRLGAPVVNVVTFTPFCESKPDFSKLNAPAVLKAWKTFFFGI